RELLEDHAPVGAGPHHLAAMDADLPCVARNETPEDVEQRALAASARADDRHELAVGDRQARHVEHLEGLAVSRIRLAGPHAPQGGAAPAGPPPVAGRRAQEPLEPGLRPLRRPALPPYPEISEPARQYAAPLAL